MSAKLLIGKMSRIHTINALGIRDEKHRKPSGDWDQCPHEGCKHKHTPDIQIQEIILDVKTHTGEQTEWSQIVTTCEACNKQFWTIMARDTATSLLIDAETDPTSPMYKGNNPIKPE